MDRLACISLPAFPLQLLLKREPEWKEYPAAVVEEDKPQAKILWVNEYARREAVLPGMRYAAGLSLAAELRAGVVTTDEIEQSVHALTKTLRRFSPHIEPCSMDPGVFWADASGLGFLHPTLHAWAERVHGGLDGAAFLGRIVVGFDRFKTYAIAQSRQGPRTLVLSPKKEAERAARVRLDRLEIEPKVRDDLHALGIETLDQLLGLPPAGLRTRYGAKIHELHQAARGEWPRPLQPQAAEVSYKQQLILDEPERDSNRLLFWIKRKLDPLLEQLVAQKQALSELVIEMKLDRGGVRTERLKPADPTIDIRQLLNLVMLRLDTLRLKTGVIELTLDAECIPASYEQISLFKQKARREPKATRKAFARLRAEFGDGAVVYARLKEAHLPEACFEWAPLEAPEVRTKGRPKTPTHTPRITRRLLVRRILDTPQPLPTPRRDTRDGWQLRGRDDPPVEAVLGPYVVSGGWWHNEVCREYHYILNLKGEWTWAYYDRPRRRWFLQGRVE